MNKKEIYLRHRVDKRHWEEAYRQNFQSMNIHSASVKNCCRSQTCQPDSKCFGSLLKFHLWDEYRSLKKHHNEYTATH